MTGKKLLLELIKVTKEDGRNIVLGINIIRKIIKKCGGAKFCSQTGSTISIERFMSFVINLEVNSRLKAVFPKQLDDKFV